MNDKKPLYCATFVTVCFTMKTEEVKQKHQIKVTFEIYVLFNLSIYKDTKKHFVNQIYKNFLKNNFLNRKRNPC